MTYDRIICSINGFFINFPVKTEIILILKPPF
ncbi:hypothetical protein IMSAGC008_01471 [Muribaculaceae bacterium]|nr:hypothetical protein IMSAGC008_01471 [Muribaculaceae bacterium]